MAIKFRPVFFLIVLPFIFQASLVLAQANPVVGQEVVESRKRELEAELAKVELEIAAQNSLLQAAQKQESSLERDLNIIEYQLNESKLKIKAKKLEIERLGGDIVKKKDRLGVLSNKITKQQASLAELLRQVRDLENASLVELVLDEQTVSEVFSNVDSFTSIQDALHESFTSLREDKAETETEKSVLEQKQAAEIDAKQVIEGEQRKIERNENEKRKLLSLNKTQQTAYKKVLTEREKRKTEIKSALFRLRGSDAISFGQALEYANFISAKVGVRSALILAIITQESNLGENVGTCNRPGDPKSKNWRAILKPERDHKPFLEITSELSLDPEVVPLSCPFAGGWGGAMGPSQFIPSTWKAFKSRISRVTGNEPPNPWVPQDAFAATGIYLADLGASSGGFTAERTAALKYYAGGNWKLKKNAFYGDSVMKIALGYQDLIDTLQNQ